MLSKLLYDIIHVVMTSPPIEVPEPAPLAPKPSTPSPDDFQPSPRKRKQGDDGMQNTALKDIHIRVSKNHLVGYRTCSNEPHSHIPNPSLRNLTS